MIRVKSLPLSVAVVVLLIGGVYVSMAMGYWKTTSSKEPVTFKTGELAGKPNPADIRGSYTWLDIEAAFGVSATDAAAAFSAPGFVIDPASRVSILETWYKERLPADREVGTDSLRLFVSRMLDLPFEPEEGTALPEAVVAYLEANGKADAVARAASVSVGGLATPAPAAPAEKPAAATKAAAAPAATAEPAETTATGTPATATVEHTETERKVGGSTTFGDLASWGLSDSEITGATGFKSGPADGIVRDAAQAAGATFSAIKEKLQKLVDAKK